MLTRKEIAAVKRLVRVHLYALFGLISVQMTHARPDVAMEECSSGLEQLIDVDARAHKLAKRISLLSWNIEKGKTTGWRDDYARNAQPLGLALLQEAVWQLNIPQLHDGSVYWSFSQGYKTQNYTSGVMTLSAVKPFFSCTFTDYEPWLGTPKVSDVNLYPIDGADDPLLVVNMHSINFTLGTKAYLKQLAKVEELISSHRGPVVFAGDLNSWSQTRREILIRMNDRLGLSAVDFAIDDRSKKLGYVVDHIFVKGMKVVDSHVNKVSTSDHNPLFVSLEVL